MAKQVCSHPAQVLGWQLLLLSKLWLGRWLGFPGAGSQSRGKLSHSPQKGSFLLDLPPELHMVLKAAHLPACLPAHVSLTSHPALQYSCLENSMDRGAWLTTVHEVTKSQTRLSD